MPINNSNLKIIVSAVDRTKKTFSKVENRLNSVQDQMERMQSTFRGMAVGGAAVSAAFGYMVQQTMESTQQLKHQADIAGVNVKTFQELSYAASQLGASESNTRDAMKEFNMRLAEFVRLGEGPAKDAYNALNVSQEKAQRMLQDTDKAFMGMLDRLKELDKVKRMELADKIFGGQGAEAVISMIAAGADKVKGLRQEAEKFGLILSKETIQKSNEAYRSLQKLTTQIKVAFTKAVAAIVPQLKAIAEKIRPIVQAISDWIEENPKLTKTIILTTGAIVGLVTVLGGLGLVIPKVIAGLKVLKGAFFAVKAHPLIAAIAVVTALITAVIIKFRAFADEMGGMSEAISYYLKFIKVQFLGWKESILSSLNQVYKYIPILNNRLAQELKGVRQEITRTKDEMRNLALSTDETKNKTKLLLASLGSARGKMSKVQEETFNLSEALKKIGESGKEAGKKLVNSFDKAVNSIRRINEEIKSLYESLTGNAKSYSEKLKGIENDKQTKIVNIVAKAENKLEELQNQRSRALARGNYQEVQRLENTITKKKEIITQFHNKYANLEKRLQEKKRVMAMNELERIVYLHKRERLQAKKTFLQEKLRLLKELIAKKNAKETIIKYIGQEKRTAIQAELEKTKTFKEQLAVRTDAMKTWMEQQKTKWRNHVTSINSILSGMTTGGIGGGIGAFSLPSRQTGGYIPETKPYLLHKGESVIPAGGNAGGVTINITGNTLLDKQAGEKIGNQVLETLKFHLEL